MGQYTDVETWMLDNADERVFRVWEYKKVFTPYEMNGKFVDESIYEDDQCSFMWLVETIEFENGRIMFGFKDAVDAFAFENGELGSVEPAVQYMLDGDFKMEYHPGDIERIFGGDEEEDDVDSHDGCECDPIG